MSFGDHMTSLLRIEFWKDDAAFNKGKTLYTPTLFHDNDINTGFNVDVSKAVDGDEGALILLNHVCVIKDLQLISSSTRFSTGEKHGQTVEITTQLFYLKSA
jgi:hypothetical protein